MKEESFAIVFFMLSNIFFSHQLTETFYILVMNLKTATGHELLMFLEVSYIARDDDELKNFITYLCSTLNGRVCKCKSLLFSAIWGGINLISDTLVLKHNFEFKRKMIYRKE